MLKMPEVKKVIPPPLISHIAVPAVVLGVRVHCVASAEGFDLNRTSPLAMVGEADVSVTFAVHGVICPTTTVHRAQDTLVEVGCRALVTAMSKNSELVECTESPR